MSADRTPATFRVPLHARVAAWLRAEAGDTMVEVMIAALLVALIATATFTGYTGVAQVAGDQNKRAQADALAQGDQARLNGLSLSALAGSGAATGNTSSTTQVDGTTYTITSSATVPSPAENPVGLGNVAYDTPSEFLWS